MEQTVNEISINGVSYVRKDSAQPQVDMSKMYVVRSYAAGVFYGEVVSEKHELSGLVVEMKNARRLWKWSGAADLCQLAMEGVKKPADCKFPRKVPSVKLMGVCEIQPLSEAALKSLDAVEVWQS